MIVVTGANGNIGTAIVQLLQRQTALDWRIAAHRPERIAAQFGANAPAVKFDYDDRATWPAALVGIRILFLVFPLPHPVTARERMAPLIDAAKAAGCQHIIYVSVPGADKYGFIPHHTVERHIEASGVSYTHLRSAYFAQNLCRDISTHGVDITQRGELFIPMGAGKTCFLDARDVGTVAFKVMQNPAAHRNRAYLLTGPESLDLYQVGQIMSEELGRPIRYSRPSFPRFWWRLYRRGVGADALFFMSLSYMLGRFGRNDPHSGDLEALLGHRGTTMRQFIRDHRHRWTSEASAATLAAVLQMKQSARWRTGR